MFQHVLCNLFLALLDFVSRATAVAQTSVVRPSVRKLRFLGNHCVDPGQILWAGPYPIKILWHFEILVIAGPYWGGGGFQNATPPTVFIRSKPNFMINKAVQKA